MFLRLALLRSQLSLPDREQILGCTPEIPRAHS
jgi:hypothetical protein